MFLEYIHILYKKDKAPQEWKAFTENTVFLDIRRILEMSFRLSVGY